MSSSNLGNVSRRKKNSDTAPITSTARTMVFMAAVLWTAQRTRERIKGIAECGFRIAD
jgi:hypothetical protein